MLFDAIINISRISPLVAFIVSFLLGAWIYFYNRNNIKNILFALFSLDLAIWAFACYIQSITKSYELALFYDQILYSVAAVAPALFLHCISLFTQKKHRLMIPASYFLGFIFFIINWSPFFRVGVDLNFGMRFVTMPYMGWYAYLITYSIIIIVAMYDLIVAIANKLGEERQQLLYVLFAFIVLLAGGQSYFILIFKKFNYLVDSILNLSSSVLLATYNLIMAIIITKFRFLNIWVVIRKSTAYIILLIIVLFLGIVSVSFYNFTISYVINDVLNSIILLSIVIILMISAGFFFIPLRHFIQTSYGRTFIKGWHDVDKLLADIAKELVPLFEIETVLRNIKKKFKQTIEIDLINIYLPIKDKNFSPVGYYLFGDDNIVKEKIPIDHPFIQYLLDHKDVVFYRNLPLDIKNSIRDIKSLNVHLYLPFFSSSSLEAIMALGSKASEDSYNSRDIALFRTILNQAVGILDRIRPYEKIKKEFDANQKKLYEAEIELERSRRLASLGTLIAGVTHEIRNPLSAIQTETDRLADKTRDLNYLEKHRDFILGEVKRIDNIVNRTLGLAKTEDINKTSINVNDVVDLSLRSISIGSNIKLRKELKEIPLIRGNSDQLHQVFDNLIQNAMQAMPKGGILLLQTYLEGDKVIVEVSDTGSGIPEEIQGKIFDPFFSTRHEGAGLGLSIVFQIMQYHGGTIKLVESRLGKGSTFLLRFPLSS